MKRQIPAPKKLNHFFLACGLLMSASELWKQWYLTFRLNHGVYQWWYFPFQLCSIAMYLLLVIPWLKPSRFRQALLSFLMNYSLLGGIAVFADTSGLHYDAPPPYNPFLPMAHPPHRHRPDRRALIHENSGAPAPAPAPFQRRHPALPYLLRSRHTPQSPPGYLWNH